MDDFQCRVGGNSRIAKFQNRLIVFSQLKNEKQINLISPGEFDQIRMRQQIGL